MAGLEAFPLVFLVLRQYLPFAEINLRPAGPVANNRDAERCTAKLHIPRYFNFVICLWLFLRVLNYINVPLFFYWGYVWVKVSLKCF